MKFIDLLNELMKLMDEIHLKLDLVQKYFEFKIFHIFVKK